ncbi:hypothetical protein [Streptomyces sp. NPDC008121]|uniref:hypothetical protein n=1 Tax=Streptomyces sp. NPDC008121 TaxID=3364809 RepID=UPI0036E33104
MNAPGNPEDAGKTVTTRYTHTGAGQKTTGPGGTLLTGADYSYDSHGNLAQRTDTRPESGADGAPGKPATTTTRYTYDAYNRLTGSDTRNGDAKREGDALSSTRYTLNVSGDVVKTETTPHTGDQAGKTQVTEHTVDAGGQLTAVTAGSGRHEQTFDSEGNLLTGHAGTAYTYNTLDQPLTVTGPDGNTTHYTYWADGTRRSATTGEDGTQKTACFRACAASRRVASAARRAACAAVSASVVAVVCAVIWCSAVATFAAMLMRRTFASASDSSVSRTR